MYKAIGFSSFRNICVYLFSFFLAFGKFDPFGTNGLYFDALTALAIVTVIVTTKAFNEIFRYKFEIFLLLTIAILFFFAGLAYGYSFFESNLLNVKYVAAIVIFWVFTHLFRSNPRICYSAIFLFSISCGLIAILYHLGLLNSHVLIRSDRLYIFDENPNSTSSRMAIAFIVFLYFIIHNPLNFDKRRFLLSLFIPSIVLFIIATGSRGSFLSIILGVGLIIYFSEISLSTKTVVGVVGFLSIILIFAFIQDTPLMERLSQGSLTGSREEIWSDAIAIFYDHPWGVGEGGYLNEMALRYSYSKDTHNFFVYLLICGGWVSLLLFLIFLSRVFKFSLKNLREGESLSFIILVFLVYLAAKTGGVMTYLIMWYFMAVVYSLNYNERRLI